MRSLPPFPLSPADAAGVSRGEFGLIARHLAPLAGPEGLGLKDDAAVMAPPPGRLLVLSADAMVEGIHYLPGTDPALVARKLLRVNLSDLAAMGAEPLHYLLTLSLPRTGDADGWVARFASGLAVDQAAFGITLLGGDTTSINGPAALSLTILGTAAPGGTVRRSGAQPGDEVWVTGTIGDGALGLLALTEGLDDPDGFLAARYHLPQPRLGLAHPDYVHAAADISDGLLQDLGHVCSASGLAAILDAPAIPLSEPARRHGAAHFSRCLTGGDDYELVLAIAPSAASALQAQAAALNIPVHRIGRFAPPRDGLKGQEYGVHVHASDGTAMRFEQMGWQHF